MVTSCLADSGVPDGVATTVDELGLAVCVLAQAASTKPNPAESSANFRNDLTMAGKVSGRDKTNGGRMGTKPSHAWSIFSQYGRLPFSGALTACP